MNTTEDVFGDVLKWCEDQVIKHLAVAHALQAGVIAAQIRSISSRTVSNPQRADTPGQRETNDPSETERKEPTMTPRYYLTIGTQPEAEVTEEEFVRAERRAGFHPKPGCGPVATGGFGSGAIKGRVDYSDPLPARPSLQEQIDALRGACMFVKNFLVNVEAGTEKLDLDPLRPLRQRFHAPLHKVLDHALEISQRADTPGQRETQNHSETEAE